MAADGVRDPWKRSISLTIPCEEPARSRLSESHRREWNRQSSAHRPRERCKPSIALCACASCCSTKSASSFIHPRRGGLAHFLTWPPNHVRELPLPRNCSSAPCPWAKFDPSANYAGQSFPSERPSYWRGLNLLSATVLTRVHSMLLRDVLRRCDRRHRARNVSVPRPCLICVVDCRGRLSARFHACSIRIDSFRCQSDWHFRHHPDRTSSRPYRRWFGKKAALHARAHQCSAFHDAGLKRAQWVYAPVNLCNRASST